MIEELKDVNSNSAAYLKCLKVWKENDNHKKAQWLSEMSGKAKIFIAKDDAQNVVGMIQIIPIEDSNCHGQNMAFIQCLLVNFYDEAFGNKQQLGYGKALLSSAIAYAKERGADALVAWGTEYNGLETAAWYEKQGFEKLEELPYTALLWMPFNKNAEKPSFVKRKQVPQEIGKVVVSVFNNGWCTSRNILCDQARTVALELPDVVLKEYDTFDRDTFLKYGIMEGIFINETEMYYDGNPFEADMRRRIGELLDEK